MREIKNNPNTADGKNCPFRKIETKNIYPMREETTVDFLECLGDSCPYFREWGIFCEKARNNER